MNETMGEYRVPERKITHKIDHLSKEVRSSLLESMTRYVNGILPIGYLIQSYPDIISGKKDLQFVATHLAQNPPEKAEYRIALEKLVFNRGEPVYGGPTRSRDFPNDFNNGLKRNEDETEI